ncbi:MAG: hypothetical protein A3K60_04290 [Euryarchaeota archaeon RBG_19FT_COMBO_56_21]|nr:MAG: hypothetical protein A3K60_04290 [Euryarchaeota archaeon RBG_19FT_COMBO_56_21]
MDFLSIGVVLVFGIILMPVVLLVLASIFGKPRNFRVTAIFLGLFAALILIGLVAIFVLTTLLSYLMP